MKKLLFLITCLSFFSCFGPSTTENNGGSGSEIVGDVNYAEGDTTKVRGIGLPVIQGKIFIFSAGYEANTSIPYANYQPVTLTDNNGHFRIDSVPIGTHIIEANDNNGKAVTKQITILTNDDIYDEGTFIVRKVSSLACTINTSLPVSEPFTYAVFVLGTRIYATGNNTQLGLTLGNIPYGTYTVRFKFTYQGTNYSYDRPGITFIPDEAQNLSMDFFN